jgi:tetratricopeptide (TPR) repeat protein
MRRVHGPAHPHTLDALENVAHCLRDQDQLAEALALYEQVYESRRRILGAAHPDTIGMLNEKAGLLAAQARWGEAAQAYERVLAARPDLLTARCGLAVLCLYQGDLEGYRRHCAWVLQNCAGTEEPMDVSYVGKVCAVVSGAEVAASRPLVLAEHALAANPANPQFQLARGAAAFRAGRCADAVSDLERVRNPDVLSRVQVQLFLALARQRLGQSAEARQARDTANRLLAEFNDYLAAHEGRPGTDWREWLTCRCLLREVEAAVGATP